MRDFGFGVAKPKRRGHGQQLHPLNAELVIGGVLKKLIDVYSYSRNAQIRLANFG